MSSGRARVAALVFLAGTCGAGAAERAGSKPDPTNVEAARAASAEASWQRDLVAAAHGQVGTTVRYDGSYRKLAYPGGDVPLDRGVCTDVVVRAYRALGVDLQVLVHEDMKRAFAKYPKNWGLTGPDANIDHRRVPNLQTFFTRHGEALPVSKRAEDYSPGDIVTWRLPSGLPHVGLVSTRRDGKRPLVVHNIGWGACVEDTLFEYDVTGHFRYEPGAAEPAPREAPPRP